jgi:hypothetical protein
MNNKKIKIKKNSVFNFYFIPDSKTILI